MKNIFIIVLIFFSANLWAQKLQDRAVGIWDFESSNFADSSSNSHSGTATGTVNINTTGGILGDYAETDGSGGDYITLDDTLALGNTFSIGGWVYLDSNGDAFLFSRYYGQMGIKTSSSGELRYMINNNYFGTGQTAPTGSWFHVMLTYDNSLGSDNAKFYYNGSSIDQSNETSTEINTNQDWQFAANGNGSYGIDGRLDAWCAFREALDSTTINDTLYNSGSPTYSYQWTPTADDGLTPIGRYRLYKDGVEYIPFESGIQVGFTKSDDEIIDTTDENPYSVHTPEYVNYELGHGVNSYKIAGDDWELDWTSDLFDSAANVGLTNFRHVLQKSNTDYAITTTQINNAKEIFDSTINAGMINVFDYHIAPPWWDTWTEAEKDSLASHWAQFTQEFSGYAYDELVFDIVNEPGGNNSSITNSDWNPVVQDVVDSIRAYDTSRVIMVSPLKWGHVEGLDGFTVPTDAYDKLILALHYYEPSWVVMQNFWDGEDTVYQNTDLPLIEPIYDDFERRFAPLDSFLLTNDMPVYIGEWGVNSFADSANREHYALMMRTIYDNAGWSSSWWDYTFDFGLRANSEVISGETDRWYHYLVDAIVNDTLTYTSYDSTAIHDYSTGFTSGDDSDFGTYTTGSGAMSLSVSDGELVCDVTGTDWSHLNVRLYLPDMDIKKNSIYRITFNWRSSNQKEEMALKPAGSHTWNYFYDLNTTSIETVFTLVFPKNTQTSSKFELLLGYGTGTIYIESLLIEELTPN